MVVAGVVEESGRERGERCCRGVGASSSGKAHRTQLARGFLHTSTGWNWRTCKLSSQIRTQSTSFAAVACPENRTSCSSRASPKPDPDATEDGKVA